MLPEIANSVSETKLNVLGVASQATPREESAADARCL